MRSSFCADLSACAGSDDRAICAALGLLCEYFVAADDTTAASIAGWPSGPSQPPEPRGWRRRAREPLPTVHAGGIEPVVLLAILEGLLTDTDIEGLVDDNADRQVSNRGAGEPMVFGTSDTLIDALATSTNDRISEVAVRWAEAEEFGGTADPADLTRGLAQLVGLAKEARRVDGRVYCWMSL